MENKPVIISYASVQPGIARKNGRVFLEDDPSGGFDNLSRSLYKKLQLSYPKFYKMDNLCKLAFLVSELVLDGQYLPENQDGSRTAVVLCNAASSLDTDRVFNDSIKDRDNYFPSPSVFVYTLPNISIGEICIKNKITGENAFFIFDRFDPVFIFEYVNALFKEGRADACLCGWCNYDDGNEDCFMMLIRQDQPDGTMQLFNAETIELIYNQK